MRIENKDLSTFFLFAWGSAAWLSLQSSVLILFPKLAISILAADDSHHTSATMVTKTFGPSLSTVFQPEQARSDLEVYFGRSLGFALTTLAVIVLFFTGAIPISTSVSQPITLNDGDQKAPYAMPILQVTSLFHVMSTIYCYTRYLKTGQTGYILGVIGYGAFAALGAWSVIFGFTSRVSARTGEDKRTSGFLFPSSAAYDKKADQKLK